MRIARLAPRKKRVMSGVGPDMALEQISQGCGALGLFRAILLAHLGMAVYLHA